VPPVRFGRPCLVTSLEIVSDYLQDFFFQSVLGGFIDFLGIVYLFFVGVWNSGYLFSSFPSESCVNLLWGREWFPSLFHLHITPLGAVSVPGLCVI
jgi:hypothetical protein